MEALDKSLKEKIGVRIAAEREKKGLTQAQLGKLLGQSDESKQTRLSKLEKGTLTPNLPELIKMSEIFGVSTDYLLGISDSRDNKKEFTTGDLFRNLFELEEKNLGMSLSLKTKDELEPHPYTGEPYMVTIEDVSIHFNNSTITKELKEWSTIKNLYEENKNNEEFKRIYDTWKNAALQKKDILWQDLDFYFNDQEELPFS